MDIRIPSTLLATLVCTALAMSMLLRRPRARVNSLYGVFAASIGAYHLARFLEFLIDPAEGSVTYRLLLGLTIVVGGTVPSTALAFFLEFLNYSPRASRWGRRVAVFSLVFGGVVGVTPLADREWARVVVAGWVMLALTFNLSLVLNRIRANDSRVDRLRLLYLAIGVGLSVVFSSLDFLPRFGVPFPTLGPIFSTLYLFLLSQTILRLRLMDLHELLGKTVSQTVLAGLVALVFVVLTSWTSGNTAPYLFNTVVAAFVVLILLEPVAAKVEERVVALFFRQRFAFLESVRQLQRRTANVIDVPQLVAALLDGLNETRRVTHASVYLLAEDRPGFRLLDSRGPQPALFLDAGNARALVSRTERAQLIETVHRRTLELKAQPLEARRQREELRRLSDVRATMEQMKAGITVPLMGTDRALGFLNLWDERVPEAFASDEIAQILAIADHVATVVENSKLYEKMRERDRLAALGEMAAGLAHEIRNPLGAIKGAAQCLDPQSIPGDEREFVEVIVEEVNRLNGVVTAFLDYARPLKQSFGPTDVNEVVSRTVKLIQNDVPRQVTVSEELAPDLPRVDGDAEQLKQVLINLIQNACQALTDHPGHVTIKTVRPERFGDFRGSEVVELLVIDDGPGIPTDQQVNIFVPFFTTKQKGTGLGLAICQRIVKNHGGSISVQSKAGEGTTFAVRLPALPTEQPAAPEALPLDGTPAPGTVEPPPTAGEEKKSRRDKGKRRRAG